MKIKIEYLYRDGSNYKNWGEEILSNQDQLSLDSIKNNIINNLIDKEYFIAEQCGLPVLYFDEQVESDHNWHEFSKVTVSSEEPTVSIDIKDFIGSLQAVKVYKSPI